MGHSRGHLKLEQSTGHDVERSLEAFLEYSYQMREEGYTLFKMRLYDVC